MVFGLIKDFKKDKGLNKKAKVYHTILLSLLIASYAGTLRSLAWGIKNFEKAQIQFSVDVGIVPGNIHFILFILNLVLSLVVLFSAYQMINRKETARKRMLLVFPFLGLTSIFNFYRGWLNTPDELILNDMTILLIATIIMGGITFFYFKIYNSDWMSSFFSFKPVTTKSTESEEKEE